MTRSGGATCCKLAVCVAFRVELRVIRLSINAKVSRGGNGNHRQIGCLAMDRQAMGLGALAPARPGPADQPGRCGHVFGHIHLHDADRAHAFRTQQRCRDRLASGQLLYRAGVGRPYRLARDPPVYGTPQRHSRCKTACTACDHVCVHCRVAGHYRCCVCLRHPRPWS